MRQRISDLLDGCEDGSAELTGDTPLSSARIKELTMNRITPKKQKLYRLPTRLLAAAAIVAALTASALAVNYAIGAGGLMQDFFAGDGGPLSTGQIENLDQIGQTYEGGVTDNGATITPIAAVADEHCYYLRLRVEAPEGVVLPDLDPNVDGYYQLVGNQWPEEELTFVSETGADINSGYTYTFTWQPDSDPADNVKEVVIRFTAQGTEPAVYNNQEGKILTIHGLWIQAPDKEYTPVFTGNFILDVGGHFERRTLAVDCGGADYTDITGLGYTMWLDRVELTPLSISVWFRDNVKPDQTSRVCFDSYSFCEGLQIVLKDGTVAFDNVPTWTNDPAELNWDAATMLADGPVNGRNGYAPFEQPLDLDQVDYIKFGDHIIPVHTDSAD